MTTKSTVATVSLVVLVAVAGAAGSIVVATQGTTSSVSVDATPSDSPPASGESTHSTVYTVGTDSTLAGQAFNDIRIDYSVDQPTAQVGNVGEQQVITIGIDRSGDNVGTRVDDTATISSVTGEADGQALLVETTGSLDIQAGDEVVIVAQDVQNPDTSGTAQVDVTVNSQQDISETSTGSVTYEFNNATVDFRDQETTGDTVTVNSVTLSEAGFVAISNTSSADPGEIRGAVYLGAGEHSNVEVPLDDPVTQDQELWAQAHLDTDGDQRFDYADSGGSQDELYRNGDGNIQTNGDGASAQVTVVESTATPTPTPTPGDGEQTATTTPTESSSSGDSTPEITDYTVTADGDEITVSFESDDGLVDIEVDVRGPDAGTLTESDFSGNEYEGYQATYQADSDGDYTLELVKAEDASSNDGADEGDYTGSATVSTSDDGTATPTSTSADDSTSDDSTSDDSTSDDSTSDDSTSDDSTSDDSTSDDSTSDDSSDDSTSDDSSGDDSMDDDSSGDDSSGDDSSGDDSMDDGDSGTESPTESDGPGFGPVVAVLAILGSAVLAYRRQ